MLLAPPRSGNTIFDLRYYLRYLTEHPELRKGRRCLFIPIKDNNAGKELSAATIFRWLCTTIVDSHVAFKNSKSASIKAHVVGAVATSLQLLKKVDLQTVMKVGRRSSEAPSLPSTSGTSVHKFKKNKTASCRRRSGLSSSLHGKFHLPFILLIHC